MENWQDRTALLLKTSQLDQLNAAHVLVAGLGGVGAYVAESLCRAGVGEMTIVDYDVIHPSNINRQLLGLHTSLGQKKANLMRARLMDINPGLKLHVSQDFLKDENIFDLLNITFDYVADAIDTLSPKVFLVKTALEKGFPLISSLGAGGKMNPELIKVDDISNTSNCKLGRMLRKRLHKFDIRTGFKAVYSIEKVKPESVIAVEDEQNKKTTVGTISYMPALFGLRMAAEIINDLIK